MKRPHPAHDKEYLAWLASKGCYHRDCERTAVGCCTCFDWAYGDFLRSIGECANIMEPCS